MCAYDVFGAVRSQTGTTTEWSYTGEQNDPTGLEYLRARYYEPATGRFLSQDPLPLLQRYAYAGNNPATVIDPTGLAGKSLFRQVLDYTASVIVSSACWLATGCGGLRCPCACACAGWRRRSTDRAWDMMCSARRAASP